MVVVRVYDKEYIDLVVFYDHRMLVGYLMLNVYSHTYTHTYIYVYI